jgi:hypothetical protein
MATAKGIAGPLQSSSGYVVIQLHYPPDPLGAGMKRREFITLICGATASPLVAQAQQRPTPVIGFLSGLSANSAAAFLPAFHQGLKETGYVEGQNVALE